MKDEVCCVVCGCTQNSACEGGCCWALVSPPLCSRCASKEPFIVLEEVDDAIVSMPGPEGMMGAEGMIVMQDGEEARDLALHLNFAFALGRKAAIAELLTTSTRKLLRELKGRVRRPRSRKITRKGT